MRAGSSLGFSGRGISLLAICCLCQQSSGLAAGQEQWFSRLNPLVGDRTNTKSHNRRARFPGGNGHSNSHALSFEGSPSVGKHARFRGTNRRRLAAETIATTQCPNVRSSGSFQARLELYYLYQIEYKQSQDDTVVGADLAGVERAVAAALADTLDQCNEGQQPSYAIQLSSTQKHAHEVSSNVCKPTLVTTQNITCQVVRGASSILLDGGASEISPIAYAVISLVLDDVQRVNQYAASTILLHTEFLGRIGENMVLLQNDTDAGTGDNSGTGESPGSINTPPSPETNNTTYVAALIAAVIAFLMASLCFLVVWRKRSVLEEAWKSVSPGGGRKQRNNKKRQGKHRRTPSSSDDYWQFTTTKLTPQQRLKTLWKQLRDDNHHSTSSYGADESDEEGSHAWMLATLQAMANNPSSSRSSGGPTITMPSAAIIETQLLKHHINTTAAISDLTSDSESIKSNMKMDSIQEEEPGADLSLDDNKQNELVLAELAMAEAAALEETMLAAMANKAAAKAASSSPQEQKLSPLSASSSSMLSPPPEKGSDSPQEATNTNTQPDKGEDPVVEFPAFTNQKDAATEVLSAASCLSSNRSVWDRAGMPPSYYDNSDPEAETPVPDEADTPMRNNTDAQQPQPEKQKKIAVFDALGMGGDANYLADVSYSEEDEDEEILNEKLMLPILSGLVPTANRMRREKEPQQEEKSSVLHPVEDIDSIPGLSDVEELSHKPRPQQTAGASMLNTGFQTMFAEDTARRQSTNFESCTVVTNDDTTVASSSAAGWAENGEEKPAHENDEEDDEDDFQLILNASNDESFQSFLDQAQKQGPADSAEKPPPRIPPTAVRSSTKVPTINSPVVMRPVISPEALLATKSPLRESAYETVKQQGSKKTPLPGGSVAGGDKHEGKKKTQEQAGKAPFVTTRDKKSHSLHDAEQVTTPRAPEKEDFNDILSPDEGDADGAEHVDKSSNVSFQSRTSAPGFFSPDADADHARDGDTEAMSKAASSGPENSSLDEVATPRAFGDSSGLAMPSYLLGTGKENAQPNLLNPVNSAVYFEELTSPEGLQFLEDSSNDSRGSPDDRRRRHHTSNRCLQDLRILGPVVTDSTSEDASLLATSREEISSSSGVADSPEKESDSSSDGPIDLPLPYTVAGGESKQQRPLDSSILSDITSANNTDGSFLSTSSTMAVGENDGVVEVSI